MEAKEGCVFLAAPTMETVLEMLPLWRREEGEGSFYELSAEGAFVAGVTAVVKACTEPKLRGGE